MTSESATDDSGISGSGPGDRPDASEQVTALLKAANRGDEDALDQLVELLYDELRWLAHRQLNKQWGGAPLSTTELVHEAFLKLARGAIPDRNRRHFLGSASRAMRQVLVDEARRRKAGKRDPGGPQVPLEMVSIDDPVESILAIHLALEDLSEIEPRLVRIVECRFFGGLSVEETAQTLDTSVRTVKRDWRKARAWLFQRLKTSNLPE